MAKRPKKYGNKKKKRIKKYSQENYQGGLWLKYCGDGLTRSTRDKGRKDGRKTRDDGKVPWDKKT